MSSLRIKGSRLALLGPTKRSRVKNSAMRPLACSTKGGALVLCTQPKETEKDRMAQEALAKTFLLGQYRGHN